MTVTLKSSKLPSLPVLAVPASPKVLVNISQRQRGNIPAIWLDFS